MSSARAQLARAVLQTLSEGRTVPLQEAIQLRNWAVDPRDAMLPLEEIARHILIREENQKANTAKQG
jgi:hypothetical protein